LVNVLLAMTCVATTGGLTVNENVPVAVALAASVTVTV
jgi:hypothetical protein